MAAGNGELAQLEKDLQEVEAELDDAQGDAREAQGRVVQGTGRRQQLQQRIALIRREAGELGQARSGVEKEWEAARSELNEAGEAVAVLDVIFTRNLEEPRQTQIRDAVGEVDRGIEEAGEKVKRLRVEHAAAAKTAADLQQAAAADEAALGTAQARLPQIAQEVRAAREEVARLRTAALAAAERQIDLAFYLALDMARRAKALETMDPVAEVAKLQEDVPRLRKAAGTSRAKADAAAVTRDGLRDQLAAAERDLQAQRNNRDKAIRKRLSELPPPAPPQAPAPGRKSGRPAPAPPPAGEGASAPERTAGEAGKLYESDPPRRSGEGGPTKGETSGGSRGEMPGG
jgi:chromosome segregation ATPase